MSTPTPPLQSAQSPGPQPFQPDEDMLAMLGLHPAQMQVAHGLASGTIHPQQVMDAATPKPPLQAAENPVPSSPSLPPIASPSAPPVPIASSATPAPTDAYPIPKLGGAGAPVSTLGLSNAMPRIAPPAAQAEVTPPTPLSEAQAKYQHDVSTGSGLEQFQHRHPFWGTLARVGAGIGSAMFPGIAAAIPGTDLHHQFVLGQDRSAIGENLGEQEKQQQMADQEAQRGLTQANTTKVNAETAAAGQPKPKEEEWSVIPGLTGPNGEPVQQEKNSGQVRFATGVSGVKPLKQTGETQEQNKLAYQGVIGKLDAAHLPTDPKTIDKSLDKALANKVITPEEHAAAKSYEAANQTPGTNLTVRIAGQDEANANAINKTFEGSEVIAHMPDGRRVQMSYADAKAQNIPPERLVKLSAKEAQDNRDKQASIQTTFKGLDRYRSDFKTSASQLTTTDRDALRVLAAHNQSGATGSLLAGLLDDIPLAGPLNQYANKLLEGTMTSDQYKQLSPAGKKLVSDYFTSIIDNFANMKAIMGTVGRNPMQLQAEINTIPVPYLDWDSATIQFENKRASLQGRAGSMPELYTPGSK